jgi:hypothetical protein
MIKKLLTTALVSSSLFLGAQSFTANYSFASISTTSGLIDPTPAPTATGLTFGSFSAAGTGTITNPNASGRFSFTNWSIGSTSLTASTYSTMTGSLDTAKYYKVSLTPSAGFFVTLTNISFKVQRSGTGIRSYAVRSSASSFASNLPASVVSSTNISIQGSNEFFWVDDNATTGKIGSEINLSGASYTSFSSPMTFKFYGWNAEASGGTFSIDSVTFSGSVSLATGIGSVNFDLNSNFNVYPVPCNDGVIFIENKNAIEVSKIELMDVLGNVVLTNQSTNESKIKLNLADLPSGNYFVKMSSGKQVSVKKIVVIK